MASKIRFLRRKVEAELHVKVAQLAKIAGALRLLFDGAAVQLMKEAWWTQDESVKQ